MRSHLPQWVKGRLGPKFEALGVGECFAVPVDEQTCKWASFKVLVSNTNRRLHPKRFQSRKHADGTFEVCRSE